MRFVAHLALRVALMLMPVAIIAPAVFPAAAAAADSHCAGLAAESARACYPRKISGTFSGQNREFTWSGTVSMTGRRRQTTFEYKGRAKYEWRFNDPTIGANDECRLSPDHGTIDESVGLSVNVTRTRRRGWSYSGGNGAGGGVGDVLEICPGEPDRPHLGGIERAFEPGGYSKNLRNFAGTESGDPYRFDWSFRGRSKTCRK